MLLHDEEKCGVTRETSQGIKRDVNNVCAVVILLSIMLELDFGLNHVQIFRWHLKIEKKAARVICNIKEILN